MDVIFPREIVLRALERFQPESRGARIELYTEALSGTHELISNGSVDLGLCGITPTGFLGRHLLEINMVAVAHRDHPLLTTTEGITEDMLSRHLQIVVRDSGSYRRLSSGWLGAEQRWTVADFRDSIACISAGLGFGFIPRHMIRSELDAGTLATLPLAQGSERSVSANLVLADRTNAGPGTLRLADLIMEESGRAI